MIRFGIYLKNTANRFANELDVLGKGREESSMGLTCRLKQFSLHLTEETDKSELKIFCTLIGLDSLKKK